QRRATAPAYRRHRGPICCAIGTVRMRRTHRRHPRTPATTARRFARGACRYHRTCPSEATRTAVPRRRALPAMTLTKNRYVAAKPAKGPARRVSRRASPSFSRRTRPQRCERASHHQRILARESGRHRRIVIIASRNRRKAGPFVEHDRRDVRYAHLEKALLGAELPCIVQKLQQQRSAESLPAC